jgi:hypothetical protein
MITHPIFSISPRSLLGSPREFKKLVEMFPLKIFLMMNAQKSISMRPPETPIMRTTAIFFKTKEKPKSNKRMIPISRIACAVMIQSPMR